MASKQYYSPETAITWKASGGDKVLTFASTPNNALAVGDQLDRGAGAKPGWFRWTLVVLPTSLATAGFQAIGYLGQSLNGTDIPGRLSTSDSEITSATDRVRNLTYFGTVIADATSGSDLLIATGYVYIYGRYLSPAIFNTLGVALSATETDQYFLLQPYPPEQQ